MPTWWRTSLRCALPLKTFEEQPNQFLTMFWGHCMLDQIWVIVKRRENNREMKWRQDGSAMLCVLSEVLRKQYGAWHVGATCRSLVLDACETCPCLVFALLEAWMIRLVTNNRITEIQWLLVKINPYYAEGPRQRNHKEPVARWRFRL